MVYRPDESLFMGTVKLGPRGQIVIPKEVREMFGIKPGDMLLLLADRRRGVALQSMSAAARMADDIFAGRKEETPPAGSAEERARFAGALRQTLEEEE